ncbi:hypothetical protein GBL_3041 [Geobacillus kaustophilus GBlys]|uniref:Uncharacterized protein n=1 Tax=Geobacillus kaustophilus GBlys TaxID=1337888 RepID=U2Y664_GEOKU|nr:hypothetical protein GBL_3041 [Geobacillus kaustophilus GBlys]
MHPAAPLETAGDGVFRLEAECWAPEVFADGKRTVSSGLKVERPNYLW